MENLLEKAKGIKESRRKTRKHSNSPMQPVFWLTRINPETGKLYTNEEAINHIKSFRKCNKAYWTKRGFSEEEAAIKVQEYQRTAGRKGVEAARAHPEWNPLNISYWINLGFSEEEGKAWISERQRTFSLEKCIEKYGEEEGRRRWQQRQDLWQQSLNSKSQEDKDRINQSKNIFKEFYDNSVRDEAFFEKWRNKCEVKHLIYIDDVDEALNYIARAFVETGWPLFHLNTFVVDTGEGNSNKCPPYLWKIFGLERSWVLEQVKSIINDNESLLNRLSDTVVTSSMTNHVMKFLETGEILRSKNEILFYNKLKDAGFNEFEVDKRYPNSNMRFDFKVGECMIEIAGMIGLEFHGISEDYISKMKFKRETFGAFIVMPNNRGEYDDFIHKVLIEKDAERINYYLTRPL